jgi:hypothetical protein
MGNQERVVAHPIFGEGTVIATRWDGVEARVEFRSGLSLWLPARWLRPIQVQRITLDQVCAKRLLEAFRLGVVPHQDVEYFTFGRSYEISEIEKRFGDLTQNHGGVFLIEGGYGSGKTHLLEYTRHLALKRGIATAYCELSTQETPLYRPKRVYRELMYSLRYIKKGTEYSFRDLLRGATSVQMPDHCFLSPVLKRLQHMDDGAPQTEVFWQWVEGESTKDYATDPSSPYRVRAGQKIPALYDFSTATDFYSFIVTGLSSIAHNRGLGGLLIILDEVETITHLWDYRAFTRSLNFLEGLIMSALNSDELKQIEPRMLHNKVRPTPYTYKDPHLLLMLAMTPVHGVRSFEGVLDLVPNKIHLRKFSRGELETIFDNLIKVYKNAYPLFSLEVARYENILNTALRRSSGELREFIKFVVEAFDWLRLKH